MISANAKLIEQAKVVTGLAPVVPSSSTPDYVSLKGFERASLIIVVKNATTVTGSAITVKQATAVAGTGEKAVAFDKMYANIDTAAAGGDALTETAVVSDTFTTDSTNSKDLIYVIEIKAEDLDIDGGFDCIRLGTGNAVAATVCVLYVLYPAKFGAKPATVPAAITD